MDNKWKQVPFLSNYEAHPEGFVRNKSTGLILQTSAKNSSGYIIYRFGNKSYSLHRIIAETFIPNPNNLPTVEHIDRCQSNCKVSNLTWASWEDQWKNRNNRKDHGLIKEADRILIRQSKEPQKVLAQRYGVGQPYISMIQRGKR